MRREERRRRSEAAILAAARAEFAARGYDRTGIRDVARAASVDPALVMQYFGSKEGLFAAAARWGVPLDELTAAPRDDLPRAALQHVIAAFEDPDHRAASEALLRSSLTHPAAQDITRDDVMAGPQAKVAATIGGPDAELRAALLNACMLGLSISRYLLEVPALAEAGHEDLERVLGPALRALVDPDGAT